MIILDVNILVAAAYTGHSHHARSRCFLEDCLQRGDVAIPDVVWSGLIRTVTNPKAVGQAQPWSQIRTFMNAVRNHPNYRADVRALTGPLDSFTTLCQMLNAHGNLISDAYIAAIAIEHNASVGTWDTDFDAMPVLVVRP
ncbi:MAG: PIN domain-containing protein [Propionibacteriaceae bacterium]|nr:PIN domain-containing protein [Propionibacteriaceae bacterium]